MRGLLPCQPPSVAFPHNSSSSVPLAMFLEICVLLNTGQLYDCLLGWILSLVRWAVLALFPQYTDLYLRAKCCFQAPLCDSHQTPLIVSLLQGIAVFFPCLLELQLKRKSTLYICARRKWGTEYAKRPNRHRPCAWCARVGPQRAEPATPGGAACCIFKHEDPCHRDTFLLSY